MNGIAQDLRYSLRQLRKSPGFTTVAVLTLALGIGANTAIFTVVNALLLKMLPVKDPARLVIVGDPTDPNSRSNGTPRVEIFSYPLYKELRDHNSVFGSLAAAATDHRVEVGSGDANANDEKVIGRMVSGNYFPTLGLSASTGRLFSDSDDTAEGANPVVVLGYAYWQRRFAGSSSILGASIRLNGFPFTVIGIAPPGFEGDVVGEQMALFVPLSMQPQIVRGRTWRHDSNSSWLSLIGRLKPGTSAKQAEANLNLIFQQAVKGDFGAALSADDRNALAGLHIDVSPGGGGLSQLRSNYRTPLFLLMGIVGLVLLIACVNVANLLLARMSTRTREVAVRMAIGATARRVVQQMLTESLLLAIIGGIAGSVLALWGVRLLVNAFDSNASLPLVPDLRVLAFTLGVIGVAGVLFGMAPAIRTFQVRVSPALKDSNRTTSAGTGRFSWAKGLIAGQVALSLLVLFAAGMLVRSLQKLMSQDFGYTREHLVISRIDPTSVGYTGETIKPLAQELVSRLATLPGITGVTYSTNGLFSGTESADAILVPGFNPPKIEDRDSNEDYVGPEYFSVVGIPILSGRGIENRDTATSTRVAVVNEAMVKHFFGGQNPIGRQFRINNADWLDKPITIVGVSHNAKDQDYGLRDAVQPRFYMAMQQVPQPGQIVIEARTAGDASAAAANILSQIKAVNSHLPVSFVKPLQTLVNDGAADQIALARLSSFFAVLALLLACIGLYGVMSYTVAGRTREIGVRMALGARRADVVQLILREGLVLVSAGIMVGIPLALASSRFLHSFLFEMRSVDPISLASVVLLLGLVGAFAGLIPARRAAKVDPMVALRYE